MEQFDFNEPIPETIWAIEPIIPFGHFIPIIAQAGVGKSMFAESIAVHAICGVPFCGFTTVGGDVLLIDNETATNTLKRRLQRLQKALGVNPIYKLYLESLQNHTLYSLPRIIEKYPTVRYIILDSLTSLCGNANPNKAQDLQGIVDLKQCLSSERVILMVHHISEHSDFSINALMTESPNKFSMYSSLITQQADTYFIIAATACEGRIEKLYIRPVSKREAIPTKPFVLDMVDYGNGTEQFKFNGLYETGLREVDTDILDIIKELGEPMTVKAIYERMGWKHGVTIVRDSLHQLTRQDKLVFERGKHNLFTYSLPKGDSDEKDS